MWVVTTLFIPFFIISVAAGILLFSFWVVYGVKDEELVCPWHISRHFKAIESALKKVRLHHYYDYSRRVKSVPLTYGLHAVIDISPQGEVFALYCNVEAVAFAADLQYWLEQSRALHFEVRVFPDYERLFLMDQTGA